MKPNKIMTNERLKNYDGNQDGQKLLAILINRPLFNGKESIGQTIQLDSQVLAKKTVDELDLNINIQAGNIIQKILTRSVSWNYQSCVDIYQGQNNLNSLLDLSVKEKDETDVEARQWWANTIGYETRAAIKRQQSATNRKFIYQQEIAITKIKQLQTETDEQYSDRYNRFICEQADRSSTDLKSAKQQIDSDIRTQITDSEIINMLASREYIKRVQGLSQLLNIGQSRLNNQEQAISFAALRYELDRIKTDDVWEQKIRLQEIIFNGLNGNQIYFVTMLCTINEFDYQGSYNLNPDLNAYKNNPKVEPVPLIIDEMASIVNLFRFYGINCSLNMFVADTDYTEIGANGPITDTNLANLKKYMTNLKDYVIKYNNQVNADTISSVTDNNSLYQATKTKILEWVVKRRNDDFNRTWGQKWEDDVESRSETFGKKKLYPPGDIRRESLRVAQNIWAVNAAQGAIFSNLGQNTIILSTERRNRDANYVVDKETTADFPPVLYVLKAAENWNRKIINKNIFEAV